MRRNQLFEDADHMLLDAARSSQDNPARVDRLLDRHLAPRQGSKGRRVEITAGSMRGPEAQVATADCSIVNEQVPLATTAAVDLQGHALLAITVLSRPAQESVEVLLDLDGPLDRLVFCKPKVLLDGISRHAHQQVVIHLGAGQVRQGPSRIGQVENRIVTPVGAVNQHLVVEQPLVGGNVLLAHLLDRAMRHEPPDRVLHHALEQLAP